MLKKMNAVPVALAAALLLGACGGDLAPRAGGTATVEAALGGDFSGNFVKIKGVRSVPADGKYPCSSSFEACLSLDASGSTAPVRNLCPSVDDPAGTWRFEFVLYADKACANQLANLTCAPNPNETLAPGKNVNAAECYTRNADKAFDLCVVDPITGAGRENCPPALKEVLILQSTVVPRPVGHPKSPTELALEELGFLPVIVTPEQWATMTLADFSKYRAIVLGDPLNPSLTNCYAGDTAPLAAAEANTGIWGPAVTGNILIIGTDPTYHVELDPTPPPGAYTLIRDGVNFAAFKPYQTGLYVALACYYVSVPAATPTTINVLGYFGEFLTSGTASDSAHIVGSHPALADLTDADLSGWGSSIHEIVDKTPGSSFQPFALKEPGDAPYIVARGLTGP